MQKNKVKAFEGVVVSIAGNKTIGVESTRLVKHKKFKKFQRRTSKVLVHDENGLAKVGQKVSYVTTKPFSRSKAFALHQVLIK